MSSAEWEEKLSLLADHFRQHAEVVAAYLFGSVARGTDDHLPVLARERQQYLTTLGQREQRGQRE